MAPDSVYDLRARLRGLLTTAADWEWIPEGRNPAAGRLRLPERLERQRPIPTPQQFRSLLNGLRQPYRAIVAVAGLGGLRRGEIAALRWNDLEGTKLRVDEAVYRGELGTPKSKKSRRSVSIPSQVLEALEDWRGQCKFTQPEDFMFSIRTNSPIDLNREMERTIKPIEEKLGMPRFSWHDFRHAYTTWGRQAGVEAEVMRDQVGHASVAMTQDVSTHFGDRGAAADRIGAYVFAAEEAVK
ncbi:MAG: site-specific integrase, partial [Acidobacteria bacterium]|nr:site-specific integrase [Acidobacteriota bacterium]